MLTPIYFAAEFGYNDIVRLLLDNGTSTAFLNKAPSPLVASIKNKHSRVAFSLIQNGADPNGSEKSDENAFAISIKNDQISIFRLLLSVGVKAEGYEEMMSEEMKEIFKEWDVKPSEEHKEFENELNVLISRINIIQSGLKDFIKKADDVNVKEAYLSLIIGEIHENTFLTFDFIKSLESFFKKLKESRLSYLKKQFDFLAECEREQLKNDFTEDEKKWKELIQNTMNILKNCRNTPNSFPGNCYPQVEAFQKTLLKSRMKMFEKTETKSSLINAVENRSHLLALNEVLTKYKVITQDLYDDFVNFQDAVTKSFLKMKNIMLEMRKTIIQEQQLNVDFSEISPETIPNHGIINSIQEKTIKLDTDISFLVWEINKFNNISNEVLRTLRYCIN